MLRKHQTLKTYFNVTCLGMRGIVYSVIASVLILGGFGLIPQVSALTVFSADFESGVPSEFTGYTSVDPTEDFDTVGPFGDVFLRNNSGELEFGNTVALRPTTLTLTDLPPHSSIDVNFLLATIDTWDGTATSCGVSNGPDVFAVTIDGVTIFSETFDNSHCGAQTYISPSGVELARYVNLGFNVGSGCCGPDSAYDMGLDPVFDGIEHTSSTLTIEWTALHKFTGFGDESWAIDNVEIILSGVDSDGDGIPDDVDVCPGSDDTVDVDADGIPDGCDTLIDSDNDGVADSVDVCPGGDDNVDTDTDGTPDFCDTTPNGDGPGGSSNPGGDNGNSDPQASPGDPSNNPGKGQPPANAGPPSGSPGPGNGKGKQ